MAQPAENIDVRARILREATRLFAARGYDGTPIEEIARAAGVTRPTLVYHFGSKDDLRREVLAALLVHWSAWIPSLLEAATTGSDRFSSTFDAITSFFRAEPARARLLVREMLDRPEEMAALFREHLQPWTALVTDAIKRGQDEGRIRAGLDADAYVLCIVNTVIASAAADGTRHVLRDPPDDDRLFDELRRLARSSLFNDRPV